jgi:integrase/recombinase XerD
MPNYSGAQDDGRLLELWLADKAPETRRQYAQDLERFYDYSGGKPLSSVTLADLQEFSGFVSVLVAPATAARMLSTLKSLFSFANKVGYLPYNAGAALRLPAVKNILPERMLTEAEVHRMIERAGGGRDRVLLLTLYAGGFRREDACRLKWRDVKEREDGSGQITVFGKGGKTGFVLLPESVMRELLPLRRKGKDGALASDDEPVFRSRKAKTERRGHLDPSQVNKIVKRAAKKAGLSDEVSPHWLRHSHATHAKRRGADLDLIMRTLRHASLATTGRYLHADPSDSSAMYLGL